MRKLIKICIVAMLLINATASYAQTAPTPSPKPNSMDMITSVLGKMPGYIRSLKQAFASFGKDNDKEKFIDFSTQMEAILLKIRNDKALILKTIDKNLSKEELKKHIDNDRVQIRKLRALLEQNDSLIKGLNDDGFGGVKLAAGLDADFMDKDQLLRELLDSNGKIKADNTTIKANLNAGIADIDNSLDALQDFNKVLRGS